MKELKEKLKDLAQKYSVELSKKVIERTEEMKKDDN